MYKKIDGDDYQPETVDITDDGNYVYRNNLGTRINVGNFTNNSNIPGYITTHYNNEGNVISRSTIISREFIDYGTTIIKTIGESFLTGKFGNPRWHTAQLVQTPAGQDLERQIAAKAASIHPLKRKLSMLEKGRLRGLSRPPLQLCILRLVAIPSSKVAGELSPTG